MSIWRIGSLSGLERYDPHPPPPSTQLRRARHRGADYYCRDRDGVGVRYARVGPIICAWLAISVWNAGAYNASLRAEFSDLDEDPRHARMDFTMSVLFGLIPQSIIVAPFMTGFYQDGWTLTSAPFPCVREPEIYCGRKP